jgi:hypothetical protein
MAAARDNLSRRSLLGAAVAAPAFLAEGAVFSESAPRENRKLYARWGRALADYARAEATVEVFRVRDYEPAHRAFLAIRGRWPVNHNFDAEPEVRAAVNDALAQFEPFEDRLNELEIAQSSALKRLLCTQAPDLPALALKIDLAIDQEVATLDGGERCLAVLKADARRLAGPAN